MRRYAIDLDLPCGMVTGMTFVLLPPHKLQVTWKGGCASLWQMLRNCEDFIAAAPLPATNAEKQQFQTKAISEDDGALNVLISQETECVQAGGGCYEKDDELDDLLDL